MNIGAMMKGAKEIQKRMESAKAEVSALRCTGSAGGGVVTVVAGSNTIESITINPEALADALKEGDDSMLADLILLACNDALGKVKETSDKVYSDVMPAGMPAGLSGLL